MRGRPGPRQRRDGGAVGLGGRVRTPWCAARARLSFWAPKAVRSSAGAVFHVPIVSAGPPGEVLSEIGEWGIRRLGTVSEGGADYAAEDLTARVAFVFGNEAAGLPLEELRTQLDGLVSIPMAARCGVAQRGHGRRSFMFRGARQRRYGAPASSGPLGGTSPWPGPGRMNAMSSDGRASLGELIAAVSHELRQPLASIRGLTEMMLGHWADFTDDDKVRMLQGVLHDARTGGPDDRRTARREPPGVGPAGTAPQGDRRCWRG